MTYREPGALERKLFHRFLRVEVFPPIVYSQTYYTSEEWCGHDRLPFALWVPPQVEQIGREYQMRSMFNYGESSYLDQVGTLVGNISQLRVQGEEAMFSNHQGSVVLTAYDWEGNVVYSATMVREVLEHELRVLVPVAPSCYLDLQQYGEAYQELFGGQRVNQTHTHIWRELLASFAPQPA